MFISPTAHCSSGTPYLGCSMRSLNDKPGMEIVLVNTDSPAWHAGLKFGDILLEIDGKLVNNITDYRARMSQIFDGDTKNFGKIEFKVSRKDQIKIFNVVF